MSSNSSSVNQKRALLVVIFLSALLASAFVQTGGDEINFRAKKTNSSGSAPVLFP